MKLYVMRHADAGPSRTNPQEERWRGLTPDGCEAARAIARKLLADGDVPKAIFASNYNRTQQTADELGGILGCPVNLVDELAPHMPFDSFLDAVLDNDDSKRVMVVGHSDNIDPWLEENANDTKQGDPLAMGEVRKLAVDRKDCSFDEKWRIVPSDVGDFDDSY